MKIATLTRYGNLAASTRQRFVQYQPYLRQAGFEVVPCPLLDDGYLQGSIPGRGRAGARLPRPI